MAILSRAEPGWDSKQFGSGTGLLAIMKMLRVLLYEQTQENLDSYYLCHLHVIHSNPELMHPFQHSSLSSSLIYRWNKKCAF